MSSEPPTKEFDLKDEEQTDPHLRMPTASTRPDAALPERPPSTPAGPKPMAAVPKRTLGATGSIPTTGPTGLQHRSRPVTPVPPAPLGPPPLRPSQLSRPSEPVPARPPILPSVTRFGPAPSAPPPAMTPPEMPPLATPLAAPAPAPVAMPANERISSYPSDPGSGPILATMLIPRPGSPPPATGRVSDPGGDPLRERLAKVEVQSAATRSIALRIETEAARAHGRIDAIEPRITNAEAHVRDALAKIEQANEATRQSLEMRVTQVELVSKSAAAGAPAPAPARQSGAAEATELATPLRTALATIRQELAEHERKFEARRARIESLESRLGMLEVDARLVELRRMTEGFDLRIVAIERDHANAQADLDRKLRAMISEMEERITAKAIEAAKEIALQTAPAQPATKKAAAESELRKIKGVGPKYQKALTELGITTVAAVAALGESDLARIAAHLSMPVDKLKKLGWVETARALSSE